MILKIGKVHLFDFFYKSTNQQINKSSIHQFINSSIHQFINSSIHQFINSSIHQFNDSTNQQNLSRAIGINESTIPQINSFTFQTTKYHTICNNKLINNFLLQLIMNIFVRKRKNN